MQYSRWGLTQAEERGKRTSLNLLATLFLMHPRVPLAFLARRTHIPVHCRQVGPR